MATVTLQVINVHAEMGGQEKDVKSPTVLENQIVSTEDTATPRLILLYVQIAHKVGWVLGVKIIVFTENKYQWIVETVSAIQDGSGLVVTVNALDTAM